MTDISPSTITLTPVPLKIFWEFWFNNQPGLRSIRKVTIGLYQGLDLNPPFL